MQFHADSDNNGSGQLVIKSLVSCDTCAVSIRAADIDMDTSGWIRAQDVTINGQTGQVIQLAGTHIHAHMPLHWLTQPLADVTSPDSGALGLSVAELSRIATTGGTSSPAGMLKIEVRSFP